MIKLPKSSHRRINIPLRIIGRIMEETKMKSVINAAALLMSFAIMSAPSAHAATSFSWSVEPGPHGGYRVSTSTGNYMVVFNGNRVWVGTEDEFDHERVKSIMARDGLREFKIDGRGPNETSFVSRGLPSVNVGSYSLADINTYIDFGGKPGARDAGPKEPTPSECSHTSTPDGDIETCVTETSGGTFASKRRPKKSLGSEYVNISWAQNKPRAISAIIYDREKSVSFSAFHCGVYEENHNCEFIIPRESLIHKSTVFFASASVPPGAVPLNSIADATYRSIVDQNKPIGTARFDPSDEDLDILRRLNALDSSIPTSLIAPPP
jgi:hypothetical protein